MAFKQRWAFAALLVSTALFFLWVPLDVLSPHNCVLLDCSKCREKAGGGRINSPQRDLIVHNDAELNRTLAELLRHAPVLPSTFVSAPGAPPREDFQAPGWVLDCVTWDRKWESVPLEAEPHDFMVELFQLGKGENDSARSETFRKIFEQKHWPAKDPSYPGLQVSGPGAMLRNAQGVMAMLHVIITKLKVYLRKPTISLLDIPCGDLQWMSKFLVTRSDVEYTGADIVPGIVEHHAKNFNRLPHVTFLQWDIVKEPMNQSYDLVLSRDLLQHLWKADAMKALENLSMTGSKFLLATSFPDTTQNGEVEKDALGGRKFSYNLELPPFLLEPPVCMSYDWNVEHLGLWAMPLKQKYEY